MLGVPPKKQPSCLKAAMTNIDNIQDRLRDLTYELPHDPFTIATIAPFDKPKHSICIPGFKMDNYQKDMV